MVYLVVSSFVYCELSFVLVIYNANVLHTHSFFLCLIIPVFFSTMKLRAPCYALEAS